jgi:hypothetical protein
VLGGASIQSLMRKTNRTRHLEGVGIAVVEGDEEGAVAGRPTRGEALGGPVGIDEIAVPAEMAQLRGKTILLGFGHLMVAQGVETGLGAGQRLEQGAPAQGERAQGRRAAQRRFDPVLHPRLTLRFLHLSQR